MNSEVRVMLSSPLKYGGKDGTFREGTFVVLKAPSSRAYGLAIKIRQMIARALAADARRARAAGGAPPPADDAEPPTGSDWLAMLAASEIDLPALFDAVREILVRYELAMVDGEVPMTMPLLEALSLSDLEAVVGEYVATFPLA